MPSDDVARVTNLPKARKPPDRYFSPITVLRDDACGCRKFLKFSVKRWNDQKQLPISLNDVISSSNKFHRTLINDHVGSSKLFLVSKVHVALGKFSSKNQITVERRERTTEWACEQASGRGCYE